MKNKLLRLVLLSTVMLTLGACQKGSNQQGGGGNNPGGGGDNPPGPVDNKITVKYYTDYTKMLQQEPEVFYQVEVENGAKLTKPATDPTAPNPDFPIFKGWSHKEAIDDDADLWNFETGTVQTTLKEFRLFGIWSTNDIPDPVPDEGAYVVGTFTNWKTEENYFMDFNPDNDKEYYITDVSLKAGDELKIYINTEDAWYGYDVLKTGCAGNFDNNEGNIVIKADAKYDFYFDYSAEGQKLWINQQGAEPVPGAKYQIIVGGVHYSTTHNDSALDPEFDEYYALKVPAKVGDEMLAYDVENDASWTIPTLNSYSQGWAKQGGKIVCIEAGNYDFYLKFKYQADEVYIGHSS